MKDKILDYFKNELLMRSFYREEIEKLAKDLAELLKPEPLTLSAMSVADLWAWFLYYDMQTEMHDKSEAIFDTYMDKMKLVKTELNSREALIKFD